MKKKTNKSNVIIIIILIVILLMLGYYNFIYMQKIKELKDDNVENSLDDNSKDEEGQEEGAENFPSLDSLFEDENPSPAMAMAGTPEESASMSSGASAIPTDSSGGGFDTPTENSSSTVSKPAKDTTEIDIQKELEAKFDELFGALDDDSDV